MSNNLVPQTLSLPSAPPPTSQYELPPSNLDSSRPGLQLPRMSVSEGSSLQSPALYSQPMSPSFPMSRDAESLRIPVQKLNGQVDHQVAAPLPSFFPSPANLLLGMGAMANNLAVQQQVTSLNKRKTPMDSTSSSTSPRMSAAPNKRPTQTEHRPWLQQLAALNRTNMPGEAIQKMAVSKHMVIQNKKQSPLESISAKSMQQQRLLSPKTQISPRITSESFEAVRLKMRKSLAAALAQVTREEGRSPNAVKNSESDISTSDDQLQGSQSTISLQSPQGDGGFVLRESKQKFGSRGGNDSQDRSDGQIGSSLGENTDALVSTTSSTQDFQYGSDFLGEDVSFGDGFFVKDELLQGNGLSWVLESEEEMVDGSFSQAVEEESSEDVSVGGQGRDMFQSPEVLASQIEAELFKLFDGVNKKYKEKGRSLLFNLKDRNNPELRQRVVYGEIPPDKLCSMSAEELASKELSEWRMAKAEELAQMVVLPDTDLDLKRLVKKTHKGELQVEIEQDDGLSVEVSARVPIISYGRSRTQEQHSGSDKPVEARDKTQDVDGKRDSVECNSPYMVTIPSDDQVSEVDISEDDAMKDLPPIVSLDEFMQSLDSEPPFEDLQVNAGNTNSISEKTARIGSKTRPLVRSPKNTGDTTEDNSSTLDEARSKPADGSESKMDDAGKSSKGDHVWEGSLQLSGSSASIVSVKALFKSGERTVTKEWSGCPEVKGRVRLDAFEKFLGGLRLSRSRSLMVVHLVCKESSPKRQRESISELADSYVADERVGIAEPFRGMEIYLCPPNDKTRQMLSKVLTDDQIKTLDGIDQGLIGVVVWRRIRPNPSATRNSTSSRKQQQLQQQQLQQQQQHYVSSSKRQAADKDVNVRNSPSDDPRCATVRPSAVRPLLPAEADEDDAPPGFGPGMAALQEVDDLPEFNFSEEITHNAATAFSNTSTRMTTESRQGHSKSSRPLDQIRKLVQKYGQPEGHGLSAGNAGVSIQQWNDDDDIPEWQPGSQTVLARASIIPSVVPQQQNLYTYPTTTLAGTATRTSQAARQPAWQDPRRNRGSGI